MEWEPPSAQVRELMRRGAQMTLDGPQRWLEGLYQAALTSRYMQRVVDDPVIVETIRRSSRESYLHWAAANISRPAEPVPANIAAEPLAAVRNVICRGLDESAVIDAYRLAHEAAWRFWMRTTFRLTSNPDELRELLDVSARSIGSFVEATVAGLCEQIRVEHDQFTRGTHAERRAIVARVLEGVAVPRRDIETQLCYRLGQHHTAAVIWGDDSDANLSDLDRAAEALMRTAEGHRPLSVLADAATRWVWLPGAAAPDLAALDTSVAQLPGVRIALGSTASGVDGFRTSHLEAITTQRMMARLGSAQRVAGFADVELIALVTADPERANRFIKHTLGDLEFADPELRQTVLTFVRGQCNASRTAACLFTHRNTLLRRLARAEELLPRPLEANTVQVAVALEALSWRGAAS